MADSGGIRAGRAFVEIGAVDKTAKVLDGIAKRMRAISTVFREAGRKMLAAGALITAPLIAAAKISASTGASIYDMSKRTGISTDAIQRLGFAADQSGSSLEAMETLIKRMQKTVAGVADVTEGTTGSLQHLGLAAEDLKGQSPDKQFEIIAEKIAAIEDPAKRSAAAMKVFGKSGTAVTPIIENMKAANALFAKLGIGRTQKEIVAAKQLNVAFGVITATVGAVVNAIGGALQPTLIHAAAVTLYGLIKAREWIKTHQSMIVTALKIGATMVAAGTVLVVLGKIIGSIAPLFSVMALAARAAGAAISLAMLPIASVPALVVTGLVGTVAAFLYFSKSGGAALKWLSDRFTDLRNWVEEVIGGISDALAAGDIKLAAQILWAGLKIAWLEGKNSVLAIMEALAAGIRETFLSAFAFVLQKTGEMVLKMGNLMQAIAAIIAGVGGDAGKQVAGVISGIATAIQGVGNIAQTSANIADAVVAQSQKQTIQDEAQRQKELADAQADLNKLNQSAHNKRNPLNTPSGPDDIENLIKQFTAGGPIDAAMADAGKATTRGTFSGGLAAQQLGGGAADRTAKAAEKIQFHVTDLNRLLRQIVGDNGGFFT